MTDAQTDRPRPRYNDETDEWIVAVRGTIEYAFDTMDEARAFAAKQHLDTTKPECGICGITDPPEVTHECPAGFATTTPSPNEAEIRADERRRFDELAAKVAETPAEPHRTDGSGFNVEYLDESVLLYPQCDDDSYAVAEFAQGATFTEALAATQSTQAEAGDGA